MGGKDDPVGSLEVLEEDILLLEGNNLVAYEDDGLYDVPHGVAGSLHGEEHSSVVYSDEKNDVCQEGYNPYLEAYNLDVVGDTLC